MKIIIGTIFLVLVSLVGFGQFRNMKIADKYVEQVKQKLYVVTHKSDGEEKNKMFLEAVKKYWKFCEYEVISEEEIKAKFKNKEDVCQLHLFTSSFGGASNMVTMGISYKFEEDAYYKAYASMAGSSGGQFDVGVYWPVEWKMQGYLSRAFSNANDDGNAPIAEGNQAELASKDAEFFFAIGMQRLNHIWSNTDDKVINKPYKMNWKAINKTAVVVKKNKLLIAVNAQLMSEAEVKASYDAPFEFADAERIYQAVINQEDVYLLLFDKASVASSGGKESISGQMYIYNPSTAMTYFHDTIIATNLKGAIKDQTKMFEELSKIK